MTTALRIIGTITAVAVVAIMVFDQLVLEQMTRKKWALVPLMLALLIAPMWQD